MDEKRKPVNGTFTQVPNVFFDTCNLPETAQILYLRLFRKYGYTGAAFTGSIRDLAKAVRYSKSTTDRLIKMLRDANLVRIEHNAEGTMTITLNTSDLWALNKYHYEVRASQIWDSKLPSVPEMRQTSPENGTVRGSQIWDAQNVPFSGQNQAQRRGNNTNNTANTSNSLSSSQKKSSSGMTNMKEILERQRRERGEQ